MTTAPVSLLSGELDHGDGGDNNDDANGGAGGTLVLVGIVGAILVRREKR